MAVIRQLRKIPTSAKPTYRTRQPVSQAGIAPIQVPIQFGYDLGTDLSRYTNRKNYVFILRTRQPAPSRRCNITASPLSASTLLHVSPMHRIRPSLRPWVPFQEDLPELQADLWRHDVYSNVLDLRSTSGGIRRRGKARLEFRNVEAVLHT